MKCAKCGKPISEEDFRKRYEELTKQGITPSMITICEECRHKLSVTPWHRR